jgi:hypothetical protein
LICWARQSVSSVLKIVCLRRRSGAISRRDVIEAESL